MDPIVLIHGYSAESRGTTPGAIRGIYGSFPDELRSVYGPANVVEIDLSRYVSLEDGLTVDDLSRAFAGSTGSPRFRWRSPTSARTPARTWAS